MPSELNGATQAIQQAQQALEKGDRCSARRWAGQAAALRPDLEEAWLILAALASPPASVAYLEQALRLNPGSRRALAGLEWAQRRLRSTAESTRAKAPLAEAASRPPEWLSVPGGSSQEKERGELPRRVALLRAFAVLILVIVLASQTSKAGPHGGQFDLVSVEIVTATPLPGTMAAAMSTTRETPTGTSTPTMIASATPTRTRTPHPTLTPTNTPTSTPAPTQMPTETSVPPTPTSISYVVKPGDTLAKIAAAYDLSVQDLVTANNLSNPALIQVSQTLTIPPAGLPITTAIPPGPKHILVNLSEQRLYAMQGEQVVYDFRVSTGRNDSTLPGTFSILNKNPRAYSDPWGFWMPYWMGIYYAGPNLQNGIHALPVLLNGTTIWGDQLGTPVSYGCIVLDTADAQLLYYWAGLYTPVEITR
jgi:LysM repeat protein